MAELVVQLVVATWKDSGESQLPTEQNLLECLGDWPMWNIWTAMDGDPLQLLLGTCSDKVRSRVGVPSKRCVHRMSGRLTHCESRQLQ